MSTPAFTPGIQRFLKRWNKHWAQVSTTATIIVGRDNFATFCQQNRAYPPKEVQSNEEYFVESNAEPVRLRIFRANSHCSPVLVYLHGGGWVQGSPETHWDITAQIAAETGATVISVDYALAPENPYPMAFLQSCAVIKWVIEHAIVLNLDPSRIALAGDSAGGNLAAVLAIWARNHQIHIAAQLLIYPVCDFNLTHKSCQENMNGPILTRSRLNDIGQWYCPDAIQRKSDCHVAPLNNLQHSNLAPAFIATAQFDPARDSGTEYVKTLSANGVDVELDKGKGLIHGYLMAINDCPEAHQKFTQMTDWLARKLDTNR